MRLLDQGLEERLLAAYPFERKTVAIHLYLEQAAS
jgi:hypothetical protein